MPIDMRKPRPEAEGLKVGDEVLVHESHHRRGPRPDPVRATVEKAGPVWLVITDGKRQWKLKRATQNEDSGHNYQARFVTPEQHEYDEMLSWADRVIADAGIYWKSFNEGGWRSPNGRVVLATLISGASPEDSVE